jgi:hypothetical protein
MHSSPHRRRPAGALLAPTTSCSVRSCPTRKLDPPVLGEESIVTVRPMHTPMSRLDSRSFFVSARGTRPSRFFHGTERTAPERLARSIPDRSRTAQPLTTAWRLRVISVRCELASWMR